MIIAMIMVTLAGTGGVVLTRDYGPLCIAIGLMTAAAMIALIAVSALVAP